MPSTAAVPTLAAYPMTLDQLQHTLSLYPAWIWIPSAILVAGVALWLFIKLFKVMMWLSVISFVCIGGFVVFKLLNK